MKRTPEQKWYMKKERRQSLLDRHYIYALHASTIPKDGEEAGRGYYKCHTLDGIHSLILPLDIEKYLSKEISSVTTLDINIDKKLRDAIKTKYLIVQIADRRYALDIANDTDGIKFICLPNKIGEPPFRIRDWLIVDPKDIENYIDGKAFVTTYGRYLVNYYLLANPFKRIGEFKDLEFINGKWSIGAIERKIAEHLVAGDVTVEECNIYIDNGYFIGSFGELCGATLTKKAIVPSDELIKRRNELIEKYKDELDDPRTMIIIDNELVALDKEYLKNDPSMDFFGTRGKTFDVERKSQYSAVGMVAKFGAEKGKYNFIANSLTEGLKPEYFALQMNESRRGFYDRAKETSVSGTDTKFIMNTFQSSKIVMDDCHTKRYLTVIIKPEVAFTYYGRYAKNKDGKEILITNKNIEQYLNCPVEIRSVMYCEAKDGYCTKCAGQYFADLKYENPAGMMLDVTAVFTTLSMKSMHGTKVNSMQIDSVDDFVLNP